MRNTVSPKQVARALEVSESSVKRWCDRGEIPAETTPGGHRRIPISGLLDFVKASGRPLVHPDLLGLRAASRPGPRATRKIADRLRAALLLGSEQQVRAVLLDAHLCGHSASAIGDEIVGPVFCEIGDLWECGEAEVFQERHACELANRGIEQIRQLTHDVEMAAPLAIGGTVEGDYYALATSLVELTLRECGWHADSIGSNLPVETIAAAIRLRKPKLFWLSASHLSNEDGFVESVERLYEQFHDQTAIVVGGRALNDSLRHRLKRVTVCDNLRQLEQLAANLRPVGRSGAGSQAAAAGSQADGAAPVDSRGPTA